MSQWTQGAEEVWGRYCRRVHATLTGSDADADEVLADIRSHIDEELLTTNRQVVSARDLEEILARLGEPAGGEGEAKKSRGAVAPAKREAKAIPGSFSAFSLAAFGVVLPLVAVMVELATKICATELFDPLPTWFHLGLFLLIPLSCTLTLLTVVGRKQAFQVEINWLNAIALGVALAYTIIFGPLLPISLIGLIMIVGGCGLAPLLSLISLAILRKYLKAQWAVRTLPRLWPGLLLGLALMAGAEAKIFLTRFWLREAAYGSPVERVSALRSLRVWGSEYAMIRACYSERNASWYAFGWMPQNQERRIGTDQARRLYYQVTGRAFDSVKPSSRAIIGSRWSEESDLLGDFDFDPDQGGTRTGPRLAGLTLRSSRLDGVVDADAVWGYLEWTMVFRNDSSAVPREARAKLRLPRGGVVSRLTLWVEGEEREAAFNSRLRTRRAYQSVAIRQRRDPVLVTTCGPDRVLVQCFPVPPGGGEMKVRLGITFPLVLASLAEAGLILPGFIERNFSIPRRDIHGVWVDSRQPFKTLSGDLSAENPNPGRYRLRGSLDERSLGRKGVAAIVLARNPQVTQAWTRDPLDEQRRIVVSEIRKGEVPCIKHLVLVVDTSLPMADHLDEIDSALTGLPSAIDACLVLVGDDSKGTEVIPGSPAHAMRAIRPAGGKDNLPALLTAWDRAAAKEDSLILWLHGPQPEVIASPDHLRQCYDRCPLGPPLVEVQVGSGANEIVNALDGIPGITSLPRMGGLAEDLTRFLLPRLRNREALKVWRSRRPRADKPGGKENASHLARLWARDEVERLRRTCKPEAVKKALQLAMGYRLVTPVSGAVVLETQAQYQAAGLEPGSAESMPVSPGVPEPTAWVIVLVGLFLLVWSRRRV